MAGYPTLTPVPPQPQSQNIVSYPIFQSPVDPQAYPPPRVAGFGRTIPGPVVPATLSLPFTLVYANSTVAFIVGGTGYASAIALCSFTVTVNPGGIFLGNLELFMNVANQHLRLGDVTNTLSNLSAGSYNIVVAANAGAPSTVSDNNDRFNYLVLEIPRGANPLLPMAGI